MSDSLSPATDCSGDTPPQGWIRRTLPTGFLILFGVILPLLTLGAELFTGMCAEAFFDPVPSWLHALLIFLVPLANLLAILADRLDGRPVQALLAPLNGLAIGVAAWYTLAFLPLMPIAIMASLIGIGLLPLAPVLSLVAALVCRRRLRLRHPQQRLPRLARSLWPGLVAAVLILLTMQLPASVTRYGISLALSRDAQIRQQGIELLRDYGDEDELLLACYRRRGQITDVFTLLTGAGDQRIWPEQVRPLYYRVTGRPFNDIAAPRLHQGGLLAGRRDIPFDRDQGGEQVGGRVEGLYLLDSSWHGSVDANAALAYLEWTFVISNQRNRQQEARMQLRLPPGATASRVTLWINGEPKEAAFAGKSQVREAYQRIVQRHRDPLLVTQSAPDTLMVQMFPVPAFDDMKARIGITVPLVLERAQSAALLLPKIIERNFSIRDDLQHELWIESRQAIYDAAGLGTPRKDKQIFLLQGPVRHKQLHEGSGRIAFARDSRIDSAWTRDIHSGKRIHQRLSFARHSIDKGVIVIDGSMAMQGYREQIAAVLEKLPADAPFTILLAADETITLQADHSGFTQIAARLRRHDFVGGSDNLPALKQAWERAADSDNSAIVWIHGPQPVDLSPVDSLHAKWQRRRQPLPLIDLAVGEGRNRIAEKLLDIPDLGTVGPVTRPGAALQRILDRLSGKTAGPRIVRETLSAGSRTLPDAWETSDHLARLWARDRIQQMLGSHREPRRQDAIALARQYRIVSPVSGAVVLENARQYEESGLDNPDGTNVPSVPEPEEWAMILISLVMLGWLYRRRRTMTDRGGACLP